MPVKALGPCAGLLLTVLANGASATSIWPPHPIALASQSAGYQEKTCVKEPLRPFTGRLHLDSKYDQSDATKSRMAASVSRESKTVQQHLDRYVKTLVQFADHYQNATNPEHASMALACMDQWLETWARAGALQSRDASKTGIAARKWALAAISSTLLKTQALSGDRLQLSSIQKGWLDRLAQIVIEDYRPRQDPDFQYFNNHDYWAAWAVSATGMLLNRSSYVLWGDGNLRRGLEQINLSNNGDYGYLPMELARGQLAANYTHYAMVPLVLLAETAQRNGRALSDEESRKLVLLANFAARISLEPGRLPELQGQRQAEVPPYKMSWLLPFLDRHPQHAWARKLYAAYRGKVDNYSQIGGHLAPLYPNLR